MDFSPEKTMVPRAIAQAVPTKIRGFAGRIGGVGVCFPHNIAETRLF
jgi:hypothetical protein